MSRVGVFAAGKTRGAINRESGKKKRFAERATKRFDLLSSQRLIELQINIVEVCTAAALCCMDG